MDQCLLNDLHTLGYQKTEIMYRGRRAAARISTMNITQAPNDSMIVSSLPYSYCNQFLTPCLIKQVAMIEITVKACLFPSTVRP
jgi:hypothetical protein